MSKRRIFNRRQNTPRFRLPIGWILVIAAVGLCMMIPANPINFNFLGSSTREALVKFCGYLQESTPPISIHTNKGPRKGSKSQNLHPQVDS